MNSAVQGDNLKSAADVTNLISRVRFEGTQHVWAVPACCVDTQEGTKHGKGFIYLLSGAFIRRYRRNLQFELPHYNASMTINQGQRQDKDLSG